MPPILLLLNGPPGVGKSTLATLWAQARSGREVVDLDLLRVRMPGPTSDAARQRARTEAETTVDEHLAAGRSVVVPQLCARDDYPTRLRHVAAAHAAIYVEVLLLDSLAHLRQRLAARSAGDSPEHRLAAAELTDEHVQWYRDALVARAGADPKITVIECPEDQQDITLRAVEQATAST